MAQDIVHFTYQADHFFSRDFPFAIYLTYNRAEDINIKKRFQRNFWKISYILEGSGNYVIENLKFPFQKRTIIVSHPQANTTQEIAGEDVKLFNIVFDHSFLQNFSEDIHDKFEFMNIFSVQYDKSFESPLFLLTANRQIDQLIHSIYQEFNDNRPNRELMLKLRFWELLLLIVRRSEERGHRNPGWSAYYVRELIRNSFTEDISLNMLASKLELTPERICRLYHEKFGHTIKYDLTAARIHMACELLKNTTTCIKSICFQTGFRDLRHFYRCFQKHTDETPDQYRKKLGRN